MRDPTVCQELRACDYGRNPFGYMCRACKTYEEMAREQPQQPQQPQEQPPDDEVEQMRAREERDRLDLYNSLSKNDPQSIRDSFWGWDTEEHRNKKESMEDQDLLESSMSESSEETYYLEYTSDYAASSINVRFQQESYDPIVYLTANGHVSIKSIVELGFKASEIKQLGLLPADKRIDVRIASLGNKTIRQAVDEMSIENIRDKFDKTPERLGLELVRVIPPPEDYFDRVVRQAEEDSEQEDSE